MVAANSARIARGVRAAITHCANVTNGSDVEGLRHDIRNVPAHVFGDHQKCRDYFCSKITNPDDCHVELLQKYGVLSKIQGVVDMVAAKAEFLNHNKTSNM